MPNTKQKITIVALVENKPGVLNRVASLFRRRNYNVDSLTVGRTHRKHLSRMTIVVNMQRANAGLIANNLRKMVNVVEVRIVKDQPHVSRDLALIKVMTDTPERCNSLTELLDRFPARIIDIGPDVAIVEATAEEEIIEELVDALRPIGIVEMVRTGVVTMMRGTRILDSAYEPPEPVKQVAENGNGYHV